MGNANPKKMKVDKRNITLDEAVKRCSNKVLLHIGSASGYLFIGTRDEYEREIDALSEEKRRWYIGVDSDRSREIVAGWTPFRERLVSGMYPLTNGGEAIIFMGTELGDLYPMYERGVHDIEGCRVLANAIIEDAAREYIRWLKASDNKSSDRKRAIERLERWFQSPGFGALCPISGNGLMDTIKRRMLKK